MYCIRRTFHFVAGVFAFLPHSSFPFIKYTDEVIRHDPNDDYGRTVPDSSACIGQPHVKIHERLNLCMNDDGSFLLTNCQLLCNTKQTCKHSRAK